ncbi:MAG: hypothetical protein L0Z62_20100 [Gemmataceae bacterium]|nr:hypothetical protein [Gemmataceae bacterium]
MDDEPLSARERATLRAWLRERPEAEPSPEVLAAWLAGRCDERSAAAVERALAQDDALRAGLVAVRAGSTEAATAEEIARARALLRTPRWPSGNGRWGQWAGWFGRPLPAAALLLTATWFGLALGLAAGSESAARDAAAMASALDPGAP